MNDKGEYLARMGGWLVSLTLHGLSLGTALVLAAEFSVLPEQRPFRWEVAMVSTPTLQPVAADVPAPLSASSVSPAVMPRDKAPRQVRSRPNAASTQAARSQEARSGIVSPAQDGFVRPQATENPSVAVDSAPSATHTPSADRTSDEPVHEAPQTTRVDLPVTTTEPSEVPPPAVETTEQSATTSVPSIPESIRLVNRPTPRAREATVSRVLHADYGWLAEMLFRKVEQSKRYPTFAKSRRWQGNVILQAVIHEDGSISDITIVTPSGHSVLDLDAVALLEQASPVQLKYPLGQSHVVVHIPIGYRLE
ncbi:MAG: TonB family protein [Nitrospira sp.]|nr:TonB family protein [Nitrospira sp.]